MKIVRVEQSDLRKAIPVLNMEIASTKVHRPQLSEVVQRAIHRRDRHTEGLSQLYQADRREQGSVIGQCGCLGTIK